MALSEEKAKQVDAINSMHLRMIEQLHSKVNYSFHLLNASFEVFALHHERELLPHLNHYNQLISTLQYSFHTDLNDVLQTVDDADKIDLHDCSENIDFFALERDSALKPLLECEAGKATELDQEMDRPNWCKSFESKDNCVTSNADTCPREDARKLD